MRHTLDEGDRHACGSTIVTSQPPLELWHGIIGLATGIAETATTPAEVQTDGATSGLWMTRELPL